MPTWGNLGYEVLYMNPDGRMVSSYQAYYEGSMAYIVHDNGFKIPAWMIWGERWK